MNLKVLKIFLIVLLFSFNANIAHTETIVFAPTPYKQKEILIGSYLPLIDYLKRKTGFSFKLVYIADYTKLFEEFKAGRIHIITGGPLPYYELKKQYKYAKPIVFFKEKDGSTNYSCALVTHHKGPDKLRDIQGPLALTQKFFTCGYFSANLLFSIEGKDINKLKYVYLNTNNDVIEAVIRREYEAGVLRKDIAEQYKGFAIKIIKESPKWPSISVIANEKTLDGKTIKKIKEALLSLNPSVEREIVEGKFGFAPAEERDFEIIKKYEKYKPDFR